MGFAAFAALLGLIDGVVIVMVPLWPEFPPYPLAVHGKVDQLACSVVKTARISSQRQYLTRHWRSGELGGMKHSRH